MEYFTARTPGLRRTWFAHRNRTRTGDRNGVQSCTISFLGGADLWVQDILNTGVDPVFLLDKLKSHFLASGGKLLEHTGFEGAIAHPNGVTVKAGQELKARLLIDAMGHFSPIVQQARQGQTPDGICLVVGTCALGFPKNDSGDLLVSFTPIQKQCQYFWEAFPARDGRTTYLFTYLDAHRDRFSLETLFEEYFRLLPEYQQVEYRIGKDGKIIETVINATGASCTDTTKGIEQALGEVSNQELLPEYYQEEENLTTSEDVSLNQM